jgi:hypothetical protein
MTRPIIHSFQVPVQDLDASIQQRTYCEKPFLLSVDQVFGRPAWEQSQEFVGDRIPPIAYLIAEPGFLFSCFFGHIALLCNIVARKAL